MKPGKYSKLIVSVFIGFYLLGVTGLSLGVVVIQSGQVTNEITVVLLVDDFEPQPRQGEDFWPHNRLGGDRGEINGPGSGSVVWGKGTVTATITAGANTWQGVWTSLNHPIRDCTPLNFSAIFPAPIKAEYQGRITGLTIQVRDGQGAFQVALQSGENTFCPPQLTKWQSEPLSLAGGPQTLQFALPLTLTEVQNLNWQVIGNAGDFVVVERVELTVDLPQLDLSERAFLWSYAQLLANWDPASGLTRDHGYLAANEFDNVSANGVQAAAAVMAWQLGFISEVAATEIVTQTTLALLALPDCHGLWPHFVKDGQIIPGTEWSSIDSVMALIALIEARQVLGLETTQVEGVLTSIDWPALILDNGSLSHGYVTDCSRRIEDEDGGTAGGWQDFGTESWLVNLGYAAATGQVAEFDHTPPTYNGSGFIDELGWLLLPPPGHDRWGTAWSDYRQEAAGRQVDYYQNHPCYGQPGLFGLSSAEVPDPSIVPGLQAYRAFGVGGEIPPNDGTDLLGHAVIVPHYAAMMAALRPIQASAFWAWLEMEELFTPLNNVESFMAIDEPTCEQVVWNAVKGSWNLSLQTLGWGRHLAGDDTPLYQGLWANEVLRQGYLLLMPTRVFLPIIVKW